MARSNRVRLAGIAARFYTRVGAANVQAPAFNCVVTNVPGSRVPLYFAGARMVAMYGTAPIVDATGLICAVYPCAGSLPSRSSQIAR